MSDSAADDVDAAAIGDVMSITGPGSITAANLAAQANMYNQLNTLSQQLGTGDASQTYSGLGSQAGVALSFGAQLSAISGYSTTATTVGTTLTLAQSVLTQLDTAGSSVLQSINQQSPRSRSTATARRRPSSRPQAISIKFFRCSIPRSATITCSPAVL